MIRINVAQLLKHPPGTTRKHTFSDALREASEDCQLAGPVEGRVQLLRTSRGIVASLQYQTRVTLECARCLGPVTVDVSGESADEFVPRLDVNSGLPVDDEQGEAPELTIDEHHELDLTEVIRQDLLTRLPLQPLCSESCPGLCPECGQELRLGCSCADRTVPGSPFAGLAELMSRDADQSSTQ